MTTPNPNIRAEMARRGVTQADLAAALGITQPGVSARLHGRTDWRLKELSVVAETLGVPLSALLDGAAA